MSTERVLAPKDAKGNWGTEDSEDYYIPTDTSWQRRNASQSDAAAGAMYSRAHKSCWANEKDGKR